jgi:hypothetical protein
MIRNMTVGDESEQEIKSRANFLLQKDRWLKELAMDIIHQCSLTLATAAFSFGAGPAGRWTMTGGRHVTCSATGWPMDQGRLCSGNVTHYIAKPKFNTTLLSNFPLSHSPTQFHLRY